ncbi:hypothetical protein ABID19_000307 [Mesorhizobium robiniae]|uniref:Uncharacterized protein n=1 Tax=Mesorhizobium robiniae TaxID=559315 RepID=A0ABV2GGF2_9HYPH
MPEAADMVPTLVLLLCGQHYRKIVNISFSKNDDRIPPLAWVAGLDLAGIGDRCEALLCTQHPVGSGSRTVVPLRLAGLRAVCMFGMFAVAR